MLETIQRYSPYAVRNLQILTLKQCKQFKYVTYKWIKLAVLGISTLTWAIDSVFL